MEPAPDTAERAWAGALALTALALLGRCAQALWLFAFRYTSEDQTLYWYAAREFARGRIHEPYFFGQNYNPMVEAALAVPAGALGLAVHHAVPLLALLLGLLPWAALAAQAWRRGRYAAAWAALALPLLLPAAYPMLLTLAGYSAGVALAGLAAALLDDPPRSWARAGAAGLLAGLAYLANPNAALLAGPAVLRALLLSGRDWPPTAALALGAEAGLFLKRLCDRFYLTHPHWVLHRAWSIAFERQKLQAGLADPGAHWGDLAPLGLPAWVYVPLLGGAALALARRGRRPGALAVLAGLTLAAASLGVTKVHDGEASPFFSLARMYLALPQLLGWAWLQVAEAADWRPGPRAAAGAALVALAAAGWAALRGGAAVAAVAARPSEQVRVMPVAEVLADCERLTALADAAGARWVIHKRNRTLAYACTALADSRIEFLVPDYERRTWLLQRADVEGAEQVLAAEASAELCSRPPKPPWSACAVRDSGLGAVQLSSTPGRSVLDFARAMGVRFRAF